MVLCDSSCAHLASPWSRRSCCILHIYSFTVAFLKGTRKKPRFECSTHKKRIHVETSVSKKTFMKKSFFDTHVHPSPIKPVFDSSGGLGETSTPCSFSCNLSPFAPCTHKNGFKSHAFVLKTSLHDVDLFRNPSSCNGLLKLSKSL